MSFIEVEPRSILIREIQLGMRSCDVYLENLTSDDKRNTKVVLFDLINKPRSAAYGVLSVTRTRYNTNPQCASALVKFVSSV